MKKAMTCLFVGLILSVAAIALPISRAQSASASVGNLSTAELAAAGAPACPSGWSCLAMPCPTPEKCGVVEAGPTSDLGPDQWVYLNFYGFPALDTLDVHFCQDLGSLTIPPLCTFSSSQLQAIPQGTVRTLEDGTIQYSFQVVENVRDPSSTTPCAGIPGQTPGVIYQVNDCTATNSVSFPQFYCDTSGSNGCAIDIVDPHLSSRPTPANQTPASDNALVIPIAFKTNTGACAQASQVLSESEFGADQLLGMTDPATCQANGTKAVIPFNTSIDGLQALTQLDQGAIQMAFTDDPQSSSQQALLSKDHFLLVPVALSANSIGYRGQMTQSGSVLPQSGIRLTANMVAGLVTGGYSEPSNTDQSPCTYGSACPFFAYLNWVNNYQTAYNYGAFIRSDAAGTTDQMLSWICSAPAMTLSFSALSASGTEAMTGEQTLIKYLYSVGTPPGGCQSGDQFPAFVSSNQFWGEFSTPSQQSLKLSSFVASCSTPCDGFANMNWAESAYYGMSQALLQNAAGQFVAPSSDSVIAGVNDGSWNDALWTPNLNNASDPAAYAMPTVLYAAVPRNPGISAANKASLQAGLTQILDQTTNTVTSMPAGFVALPANLAAMARDEVANGIGNPAYQAPNPNTTTAGAAGSSRFSGGSAPYSSRAVLAPSTLSAAGAAAAPKPAPTPSSSPTYGPFTLTASEARLILPMTLTGGILLAILGVLMMASSRFSRRAVAVPGTDEGLADPEGDVA